MTIDIPDEMPDDETIRHMNIEKVRGQASLIAGFILDEDSKINALDTAEIVAAGLVMVAGVGQMTVIAAERRKAELTRARASNKELLARTRAIIKRYEELDGAPDPPPDPGDGNQAPSGSSAAPRQPNWPATDDESSRPSDPEMSGKQPTPGVPKPRTKEAEEREARLRRKSIEAAHSRTFGARFQRFMAATVALLQQLWQYISIKADPYWQRFKHGVRNEFRGAFPSNEAEARGELPKFKYVPPHERKRAQGGKRPDGDAPEAGG